MRMEQSNKIRNILKRKNKQNLVAWLKLGREWEEGRERIQDIWGFLALTVYMKVSTCYP